MNIDFKNFRKNGYIAFQSGLSTSEISQLRNFLLENIKDGESCEYCIDFALQNDNIFKTLFLKQIIKKLKNLSNEIYYLADLNIQINKINVSGKNKGWHIDSNFEDYLKADYLFLEEYRFYKIGIYLQDNSLQFGGGIDIKKGSHKSFKNFDRRTLNVLHKDLINKIPRKKYRVPLKAGDVVIFDSRLAHASSSSQMSTDKIKTKNMKIVLYWDVAGRLEDAQNYLNAMIVKTFINKRIDKNIFNYNFLMHSYPNSFNEFQKKLAIDNKVSFASLNEDDANYFSKKYSKFIDDKNSFLKL
jgi:hypothetical protein